MKRLLFIGALSGANARAAHTQTIAAMTEQLVELNLFKRSAVSGYHLLSSGLDTIGTINEREYLLHVNYFQSLDALNPSLDVDPDKIKRLNNLILDIKALLYDENPAVAAPNGRRLALPQ
jgi:hypothetical protein